MSLFKPNTKSNIHERNYTVTRIGAGNQGAVWLVYNRADYRALREHLGLKPSRIHGARQDVIAAKAESIGGYGVDYEIEIMEHPTYQLIYEQGIAGRLLHHDPDNPTWFESTYQGVSIGALRLAVRDHHRSLRHPSDKKRVYWPLSLVWYITHELMKMVYYMHHGVTHSEEEPPENWRPIAHSDLFEKNACMFVEGGRLQLRLIDWGAAIIKGSIRPDGYMYTPQWEHTDMRGIAFIAHGLLHDEELHHGDFGCRCTDESLEEDLCYSQRSLAERRQIAAFIHDILDNLTETRQAEQLTSWDMLCVLENPQDWRPVVDGRTVTRLRTRRTLTPAINRVYRQLEWDDKKIIRKVEEEYQRLE